MPENGVIQVIPGGRINAEIAVYRLDGAYYATDDPVHHDMAALPQVEVVDRQIFCPLHGGAFDIRTGKATEVPCRQPLKIYKVVAVGDELLAELS